MDLKLLRTGPLLITPAPPTLVEGLIARHGVTGLSADPGVGKTFLALELARAVVTGTKFLDQFAVREGAVLFVGQDASLMEYARQVRKVIGAQYNTPREIGAINPFDDKLFYAIHPGINLASVHDVVQLEVAANEIEHSWEGEPENYYVQDDEGNIEEVFIPPTTRGVDLIILDTLGFMHSANENANDEMLGVFKNLRVLAENTRAAVLVLHHHSYGNEHNSGSRWRGASSQLSAMDGHLVLENDRDKKTWLRVKKFRGIRADDFSYELVTDEDSARFVYRGEPGETDALAETVRKFVDSCSTTFENKDVVAFLNEQFPMADGTKLGPRVSKVLTAMGKNGNIQKLAAGLWRRVEDDKRP